MTLKLFAAIILIGCNGCHWAPKPDPKPPAPPVPVVDAGAPSMCERQAVVHAPELSRDSTEQGLPVDTITRVFVAGCQPFADDGPDAGSLAGLYMAGNARALLPDAGN